MNAPLDTALKKSAFFIFLIAICALSTSASAQKGPQNPPVDGWGVSSTACPPDARSMKAEQLFGRWRADFIKPPEGLPASATMLLKRHAEFSDSLAGTVSRRLSNGKDLSKPGGHASRAFLAGDLDEGLLLLDESSDNVSITGTWNGEMVAGSCGKAFKGLWKDTSASAPDDAPEVPFTLTRLP
jgi:hypothetical protein